MTVLKEQDRNRPAKRQNAPSGNGRFHHLKGKIRQQSARMSIVVGKWSKLRIWIAGGALALFIAAVGYAGVQAHIQSNTVAFYHVLLDGEEIGTVADQTEVEQLLADKLREAQEANPGVRMALDTGEIAYVADSGYKAEPNSGPTLDRLASAVSSHAVGVEVRVNGKLIGIARDTQTAEQVLARVQSQYVPETPAKQQPEVTALAYTDDERTAESETNVTSVAFVEDVETGSVTVEPARIQDADTLYERLVTGSAKPTKYTVQEGDCIGCIASKFDISPQVIYQNNPQVQNDLIRVGDVLDLTVLKPQITVETVETVTETEEIVPEIVVEKNDEMRVGEQKTIREGISGSKKVTYRLVKQNGFLMSEELVNEEVLQPAVPTVVMKGTKVVLGEGTGKFAWPVSGAKLTSSFGKRWGRMHEGVDMVGDKTIMAADTGVVEFVGTKNGYGKAVIIDHKNGFKTLYGHLSSISVEKGDILEKGDKVGVMGNTGHSTGTHLHFEIQKDGKAQNPIKYL